MSISSSPVPIEDYYLFNHGQLFRAYRVFGAHPVEEDGETGVRFTVWAPRAVGVRVAGTFNGWDGEAHKLEQIGTTGIWTGFIRGIGEGEIYKYELMDAHERKLLKADPFAFHSELRPGTASTVVRLDDYKWHDEEWMARRRKTRCFERPMLIYEVHLGSWRQNARGQFRSYKQLADELVSYTAAMGYTHIELLPITEHPLDQSWGYQTTGYFAATSRYGPPARLKALVDRCHQEGIGVILDWAPGHFCKDDHGLRQFDGEALYEHSDPRVAERPLWGTLAFDFRKPEVQSFLISSAMFWLDVYHIDGLRVDAVASMIDLHFDKPADMHTFNRHGGTENLDALKWLRKLNETVLRSDPSVLMTAEDSSAWPGVTSPAYAGGLGFSYKWNMGWMNDMLRYMETAPDDRSSLHSLVTFPMMYAYSENYILPLSHDEVVHGKRSLLNKMPGSYEEKFAQLRLFYGYWIAFPGKKLLFMGGEFGQFTEWNDAGGLDWMLLDYPRHAELQYFVRRLNKLYTSMPALWEKDHVSEGFQWIDADNDSQSVVSFLRRGKEAPHHLVVVCNFSANGYSRFRLGVPSARPYRTLLNSDAAEFGGSGRVLPERIHAARIPFHGQPYSIELDIPPLTILLLEPVGRKEKRDARR